MTTNLECAVAVLSSHRDARGWTDEAVAADLLNQLGLKPDGEAANATQRDDGPNEDEVVAAETAAREAQDKARAAREAFDARQAEANDVPGSPPKQAQREPSMDPDDLAPGTMEPNLPPVPTPTAGETGADAKASEPSSRHRRRGG